MTNKQKKDVLEIIKENGFGNTFLHVSSFPQIADQEFHDLRRLFIVAARNLGDHIGYRKETK